MSAKQLAEFNTASWFDMAVRPGLLNIVWVALYYVLVRGWPVVGGVVVVVTGCL